MAIAENFYRLCRFGLTERLLPEVSGLTYLNIKARWATDSSLPSTNDYVPQHRGCPQSQYFGNAEIAPALPFVLAHALLGSGRMVIHMAILCYPVASALCFALPSATGDKAEAECCALGRQQTLEER